jgi:hypothetical protein
MKAKIEALGMEVLEYDACSQVWVKSWDDWEKFSTSPEYAAGESFHVRNLNTVVSCADVSHYGFSSDAGRRSLHGLQD